MEIGAWGPKTGFQKFSLKQNGSFYYELEYGKVKNIRYDRKRAENCQNYFQRKKSEMIPARGPHTSVFRQAAQAGWRGRQVPGDISGGFRRQPGPEPGTGAGTPQEQHRTKHVRTPLAPSGAKIGEKSRESGKSDDVKNFLGHFRP